MPSSPEPSSLEPSSLAAVVVVSPPSSVAGAVVSLLSELSSLPQALPAETLGSTKESQAGVTEVALLFS